MGIDQRSLEKFLLAAKNVSCPQDQIKNFLKFGYVPQPKQLEFHAACRAADRESGPDEIGFGGARGPGKSHALFSQMALDDCYRVQGLKCLYLRKIGKQAKEQFEDLRLRVLAGVPHEYKRQEGVLILTDVKSRILLGHFKDEKDIDAYLGLEYDLIVIEETTTLSLSKYKALRDSNRTSKSNWRPRIYNSTNPGNIGHSWYKQKFIIPFQKQSESFTRFIPSTLDDNMFIDSGYKRKVEENTGWKLKAHRYGEWDIAAGQFFDVWNEKIHVLPRDYPIADWWEKFGGYDHGYVHPFVFGAYAVTGDGDVIKYAEAGESRCQPDQIYKKILEVCPEAPQLTIWAGHDIWYPGRDGGPEVVEQFQKLGLSMVKANIDRVQGAQHMRALLDWRANESGEVVKRPRLFIKENCWRTISSIPNMIYDEKNPEDVLKVDANEDDVWAGDDPYDETRYAIMSRWKASQQRNARPDWGSGGWFLEQLRRKGHDIDLE